ncbi:hypothetical protein KFL_001130195 [Klebsormidium nitens]|uniref:Brain protein I3 n=1 Tax=Klebsormidium nitens TaxID=105231 RepID=A0A0U9HJJ8_KLENI|nr:hypothetical protein KFL_001130195 [Klebsormidium nitens]|eukprot:GAQ82501.1 hypothetical protein KFL_001130195 [Klebsormidium nitens]
MRHETKVLQSISDPIFFYDLLGYAPVCAQGFQDKDVKPLILLPKLAAPLLNQPEHPEEASTYAGTKNSGRANSNGRANRPRTRARFVPVGHRSPGDRLQSNASLSPGYPPQAAIPPTQPPPHTTTSRPTGYATGGTTYVYTTAAVDYPGQAPQPQTFRVEIPAAAVTYHQHVWSDPIPDFLAWEEDEATRKAHEGDKEKGAAPSAAEEAKPAAAPAPTPRAVPVAGVYVAPTPIRPIPGVVVIEAVPDHEHVWGPPVPDPIAWLFCILFFPFGVIALFLCTHRHCVICGATLYDW